jgi:ABC-type uncharacterized transport system substrate-binding protein
MNRRAALIASGALLGVPAAIGLNLTRSSQQVLAWLDEDNDGAREEFRLVIDELGGEDFLLSTGTVVQWVSVDFDNLNFDSIITSLAACNADVVFAVFHHAARTIQDRLPHVKQVVLSVLDPIEVGIIDSYFLPGRNTTGVCRDCLDADKPLELLRAFIGTQTAAHIGIFGAAEWCTPKRTVLIEAASRRLGVSVAFFPCETSADVASALANAATGKMNAWWIPESKLVDTSAKRRSVLPHLNATQRPHVFGSLFACDDGAMAAMDGIPYLWYRPMAHRLRMVLEGVDPSIIPFQRPQGWVYAINEQSLRLLGQRVPTELAAMLGDPLSRIGHERK